MCGCMLAAHDPALQEPPRMLDGCSGGQRPGGAGPAGGLEGT
jgi:hypothetical protein